MKPRKPSPRILKHEATDYAASDVDIPNIASNPNDPPPRLEAVDRKKKNKKSCCILPQRTSEKKVPGEEAICISAAAPTRKHVSGPIICMDFGSFGCRPTKSRLFKAKRADDGIVASYVTLNGSDGTRAGRDATPYGPVYLVT